MHKIPGIPVGSLLGTITPDGPRLLRKLVVALLLRVDTIVDLCENTDEVFVRVRAERGGRVIWIVPMR